MIGKIKGILDEVEGSIGLIETASGLYYRVFLTNATLSRYSPASEITIYTYHHIREDTQLLFGFETKREYTLFVLLIGVNGVGPKSAFLIISSSTVDELIQAVKENDYSYFTRIKGLGKKTALKILLDLSTKFNSEFIFEPEKPMSESDKTVIAALVSLGFAKKEATDALHVLESTLSTEEKIKEAIGHITKQ
ncbi:MAG: Holliday junction branch migration protein RuvA [bacterium]|nr:Holliday junction branch migration protein RuvA [bacterium]